MFKGDVDDVVVFREVGETGGFEYVDNSHPSHEVSAKMTLHSLKKFTTYQIIVQAYNREGVGPASNTLVATTMEDGKIKHNSAGTFVL